MRVYSLFKALHGDVKVFHYRNLNTKFCVIDVKKEGDTERGTKFSMTFLHVLFVHLCS